jgi:uncharacterized UPF0160 family protein
LRCRAERAACEEAGLRDADLTGVSGVSKAKLVHARPFVATDRSREGAMEMARRAIEIGSVV